MTNLCPAPQFAPRLWHDGQSIFLQLSDNLQVLRFDYSDNGLHKALKLIPRCQTHGVQVVNAGNFASKALRPKIAKATAQARLRPKKDARLEKDVAELVRGLKEDA